LLAGTRASSPTAIFTARVPSPQPKPGGPLQAPLRMTGRRRASCQRPTGGVLRCSMQRTVLKSSITPRLRARCVWGACCRALALRLRCRTVFVRVTCPCVCGCMRVPSDGAQATSDDLAVPQTLLASSIREISSVLRGAMPDLQNLGRWYFCLSLLRKLVDILKLGLTSFMGLAVIGVLMGAMPDFQNFEIAFESSSSWA